MGRLAIRKIIYIGDNYFFESPELKDGLNIIVGANGNGKSTLMDLIYFALGGSVEPFNKAETDNNNRHKEVYNDSNNVVKLFIEIDKSIYLLERYFEKNFIFVTNIKTAETECFRIFRQGRNKETDKDNETEEVIFSDWILSKLDLNVFEMSQGTKKWKINFKDLLRLIYYDQKTSIDRIYRDVDHDNFLSDSEAFRKAIFEILIGKTYNDYYDSLAKYNSKLREKYAKNESSKLFKAFKDEILKNDIVNSIHLTEQINELEDELKQYEALREDVRNGIKEPNEYLSAMEIKRNKLLDLDIEINNTIGKVNSKHKELESLYYLQQELSSEIKQIEKIKYIHNKLSLFSPDTCPYCLKNVQRNEGKCICGSDINEDEYEQFFYSEDDYLDMILSKRKTLESMDFAAEYIKNEIRELDTLQKEKETLKTALQNSIREISKEINYSYNSSKIKELDDSIVIVKEKISKLKQSLELTFKKEKIDSELESIETQLTSLKIETDGYENHAQRDVFNKREAFGNIYKEYLMKVDKNCTSARIGSDYMPIINNGEYRESSASVHKRLMYFFTLLHLSIIRDDTNYPKLLLIDTPQKEGIDQDNLLRSISQIKTFFELDEKQQFQIILTTGYDTYPREFESNVVIWLTDEDKLFKKKTVDGI